MLATPVGDLETNPASHALQRGPLSSTHSLILDSYLLSAVNHFEDEGVLAKSHQHDLEGRREENMLKAKEIFVV